MRIKINLFMIILIPLWIVAFIKTWDSPLFWIVLMMGIKDMTWEVEFKK